MKEKIVVTSRTHDEENSAQARAAALAALGTLEEMTRAYLGMPDGAPLGEKAREAVIRWAGDTL